MEMNQFLFPAPTASYSSAGFIGEIIYVPKYARDAITGEVQQFSDPSEANNPENRQNTAAIVESESPLIKQESNSFRKSVLGGGGAESAAGFTKEELVKKNIRDGVVNNENDDNKQAEDTKGALNLFKQKNSQLKNA